MSSATTRLSSAEFKILNEMRADKRQAYLNGLQIGLEVARIAAGRLRGSRRLSKLDIAKYIDHDIAEALKKGHDA